MGEGNHKCVFGDRGITLPALMDAFCSQEGVEINSCFYSLKFDVI